MRRPADTAKVRQFMEAFARRTTGEGRVYLTGGASALLVGWRDATVDLDLKLDPEPDCAFEAIAAIKDELDLNIELAAPDQFIPELPGWRDRSQFIARIAQVDFYHYDFHAQALAKIERGHARDLDDVGAMVERGLIDSRRLRLLYERVEPALIRYPAVDRVALRVKMDAWLAGIDDEDAGTDEL